jgi:hypothetical protein
VQFAVGFLVAWLVAFGLLIGFAAAYVASDQERFRAWLDGEVTP